MLVSTEVLSNVIWPGLPPGLTLLGKLVTEVKNEYSEFYLDHFSKKKNKQKKRYFVFLRNILQKPRNFSNHRWI